MTNLPTPELDQLQRSMRELHATVVGAREDVNRIPEYIFQQWFLPMFAGELEGADYDRVLRDWMLVAKNQFGEVIVFDPATKQDLFRVPALASTKQFNPVSENGVSKLKDIIQFAAQRNHISPHQAKDYLEKSLLNKFQAMVGKPHIHQEVENTWRSIFARYGVEVKTVKDGKVVAADAATAPSAVQTNPGGFADGELNWE